MKTRAFVVLVIACVVGSAAATFVRMPGRALAAGPAPARAKGWEQFCTYRTAGGEGGPQGMLKAINADLLSYGKQNWELATGSGLGTSAIVYCFRRPLE